MTAPAFLAEYAARTESELADMLERRARVVPSHLLEAMGYSLLAGGKRIRPALLLECFAACNGSDSETALPAAMSIECIHTYSLIHDDLPCMDDDNLRRGSPTCHRRFDEATAILAADALQTLGFELLAELDAPAATSLELIRSLAIAAGCQGMVGGQVLDMEADSHGVHDVLEVERIHLHKTGALLLWCCEAGCRLAGGSDTELEACSRYGKAVGLLFQIADDILDATASTETLGKSAGKDAAQQKATYVSLLGLERAKELAREMHDIAIAACDAFGARGDRLRLLATYIMERSQ